MVNTARSAQRQQLGRIVAVRSLTHPRKAATLNRYCIGQIVTATTLTATTLTATTLVAAGCGSDPTTTAKASPALPLGAEQVTLDPADFTDRHHQSLLADGARDPLDLSGSLDAEGNEFSDVVIVVTTETKEIANGVVARVVRDTVQPGRRDRRGHLRLVRPGPRRKPGTSVRTPLNSRTGKSLPGRRLGGRIDGAQAGVRDAGCTRARDGIQPGVLQR